MAPRTTGEAARWFARLGRRAVTTESLRAFRDWRRDPRNAEAYREVETAWTKAGGLAHDAEIRAATEAALARRPLRARLRALLQDHPVGAGLAGGGLALALGALAVLAALPATYATGVGEQRLVVLKDGSRVRLNTDTRVAVRFAGGERRLTLRRGEAFFEVAHDPARPFLVDAGAADVRALGTRFDVRREPGAVQVVLVEGSVRVRRDDSADAWTLKPSQQLTVRKGDGARLAEADAGRATSWTSGRLVFRDTPLGEAVAEVNRYAPRKVVLADPALAAAPVSGVFDTGDTAAFVAAATSLFDLTAEAGADGATRLRRRPG
jgi:transmembrane sensor